MAVTAFNLVDRGIVTAEELDAIFAQLLANPGWSDFHTKSSHRLYDQWSFDGDRKTPPPPHLRFLATMLHRVLDAVQVESPADPVVPFQCFICMYETGGDSCPAHAHDCRQLTLSLGASRAFTAGDATWTMRHGDAVILDGERHCLPKCRAEGPRASLNIFYSTRNDIATRPVAVNHNPRSGYFASAASSAARVAGACGAVASPDAVPDPRRSGAGRLGTQAPSNAGGGAAPAGAAAATSCGSGQRRRWQSARSAGDGMAEPEGEEGTDRQRKRVET